ncbi:DUF433 domain-containing protein [Brucella pituitosa]|uniref:DUF433 domain-containing protein n=1 Tax=Brucella pituitosa TaxID=571256 RepID=UPI002003C009|nr:DUF433 domain-containing protein [Brucella pituitosa]MCK4205438.1 DUF433 domain-containing protein [Brucella pituitosa]
MVEIRDETHEIVVMSDDILGGTPVITGTRIPAHDVMAALAAGATEEQILTNYSSLTIHHVKLLASYREIYSTGALDAPLTCTLPEDARLIRESRVPRIRKG